MILSSFKSALLSVLAIVATLSSAQNANAAEKQKVLVVLSAADKIPLKNGKIHPTGIFLGEITDAARAMLDANYELVFVSPGGRSPTVDADSMRSFYWESQEKLDAAARTYLELRMLGIDRPLRLEDVANDEALLNTFMAVFVPGGHGPLVDLYRRDAFVSDDLNSDMGKVLNFFHSTKRPTGLICHAPAALAAAPNVDGKWIYDGYMMTAISRFTEFANENIPGLKVVDGNVFAYPSNILKARGAKFKTLHAPFLPFVVEDRELMTGQDPFSAAEMAKRFVIKLQKFEKTFAPAL